MPFNGKTSVLCPKCGQPLNIEFIIDEPKRTTCSWSSNGKFVETEEIDPGMNTTIAISSIFCSCGFSVSSQSCEDYGNDYAPVGGDYRFAVENAVKKIVGREGL